MKKTFIVLSILIFALLGVDAAAQSFPPVLNSIGVQSSTENIQLTFGVSTSDGDFTVPTLSTSALPISTLLIDSEIKWTI